MFCDTDGPEAPVGEGTRGLRRASTSLYASRSYCFLEAFGFETRFDAKCGSKDLSRGREQWANHSDSRVTENLNLK